MEAAIGFTECLWILFNQCFSIVEEKQQNESCHPVESFSNSASAVLLGGRNTIYRLVMSKSWMQV